MDVFFATHQFGLEASMHLDLGLLLGVHVHSATCKACRALHNHACRTLAFHVNGAGFKRLVEHEVSLGVVRITQGRFYWDADDAPARPAGAI